MRGNLSINQDALVRTVILLGFSGLLAWLLYSGKIIMYINPRLVFLTKICSVVLFLMFLSQTYLCFRRAPNVTCHHNSDWAKKKWIYLPFVLTLLVAFMLPNKPLSASLAANKGLKLGSAPANTIQNTANDQKTPQESVRTSSNDPSGQDISSYPLEQKPNSPLIVTDENFTDTILKINQYQDKYKGNEITMLGFVYKEQGFSPGQFGLVRYIINCCSADATLGGFLCESIGQESYKDGSWLNIKGTVQTVLYNGQYVPMIKVTSAEIAKEPQNPYIYPVFY